RHALGLHPWEPWLLRVLDAAAETFVADVHKSQMIYPTDPQPRVPERPAGRGRHPARLQAQTPGVRLDQWLAQQPPTAWQRVTPRLRRGRLCATAPGVSWWWRR